MEKQPRVIPRPRHIGTRQRMLSCLQALGNRGSLVPGWNASQGITRGSIFPKRGTTKITKIHRSWRLVCQETGVLPFSKGLEKETLFRKASSSCQGSLVNNLRNHHFGSPVCFVIPRNVANQDRFNLPRQKACPCFDLFWA